MVLTGGFVRKRVIAAIAIVAAVSGISWYAASNWEHQARQELQGRTMSNLLSNLRPATKLDELYRDSNGDLLADPPEKLELCASPSEIVFSFIASGDSANQPDVWQSAMDAISQQVGMPVTYLQLDDSKDQLEALRNGRLHVTAFGSGEVPTAVNSAGFTPICTFGGEDGSYGYHMNFIVRAGSDIKSLADLRGKKIAFTRPRSNSGYKAAMLLLIEENALQPERDYEWYFSYGHNASVHAVTSGEADAAPVASDILARMVSKGEVQPGAYQVIYESERFPPVAFGCAYNLPPKMKEGIQSALLGLEWTGTKLADEMGVGDVSKFVPIAYKDDWANIRRVDQTASSVRNNLLARGSQL